MIEAADDLYQKIKAYNTAVDGDKLRRAFDFACKRMMDRCVLLASLIFSIQ